MKIALAAAVLMIAALPAEASSPPAGDAFEPKLASACGYQYRCQTDLGTGRRLCYRVQCVQKRPFPG